MSNIIAGGSVKDGRITVKASLGSAKFKFSFDAEDVEGDEISEAELLLQSAQIVVEQVIDRMITEVEGD